MRDQGLLQAIESAGGIAALARRLGISQPSVSNWSRVPADRVVAVEAATGVDRAVLRPDLYVAASHPAGAEAATPAEGVDELDLVRAEHYLLLSRLFREPPGADFLKRLATIEGDATPLGRAHAALGAAARAARTEDVEAEYFDLFVGVGRGEVLPFASFYLTGFLNERPLAAVRADLDRLGIARVDGDFDPEDHVATLFEVVAGLLLGRFGADGTDEAARFYERHLGRWVGRMIDDVARADAADFYRAVAGLAKTWIDIEDGARALPH